MHIWHMSVHQRPHAWIVVLDHQDPFQPFHNDTFGYYYIWLYKLSIQHHLIVHLHCIMAVTNYWPLAREYSIWKTTVAALPFQTADLEVHVLNSTIEQVYNTFFYTNSMHPLCQQSEEVLFSHFVTTLNAAFERKLALEDERYESGSKYFDIPTPLRCTSRMHHVSSGESISYNPSTPCTSATSQSCCKPVYCQLSSSSSDDEESSSVDIPLHYSMLPPWNPPWGVAQQPLSKSIYTIYGDLEEDKEEDYFQTVTLDDNHQTADQIPDRHLCIHKHSLPHSLCPYPCPYLDYTPASYQDSLELSEISDFEDVMITSNDEDVPALEDVYGL